MSQATTIRPARTASWLRRLIDSEYLVLLLSAVYFAAVLPFTPDFASPENLTNILSSLLPLLILGVGQTFVLITGGIDLSVTSIIALASIAGAGVMTATPVYCGRVPSPRRVESL